MCIRDRLYALGYTEEELNRPLVGVVSSWNEDVYKRQVQDRKAKRKQHAGLTE